MLAVSVSHEDLGPLKEIFSHSRWRLFEARSCAEALALLDAHPMGVIISAENLADGTWRDLLARCTRAGNPPKLIVASHFADDRLWAEALNLGAYDVLAMPLSRSRGVPHRQPGLAALEGRGRSYGSITL